MKLSYGVVISYYYLYSLIRIKINHIKKNNEELTASRDHFQESYAGCKL